MAQAKGFFRFLYTSLYFLLFLILLGLLLVTPGDIIERSIRSRQVYNIWILVIAYFAVLLLIFLFYSVRLYINKTVIAGIPKPWVPIEAGDVNNTVYRLITAGLDRSAAIAYESRPRNDHHHHHDMPPATQDLGISTSLQKSIWDDIEHGGWASPKSPEFPHLQYSTVLAELPNLVEAKALTLAPADPTSQTQPPIPDPEAVALLQRPPYLSLRGYVDHLCSLGVLPADQTTTDFLHDYEYARFSTLPLSNARFRRLMRLLSEVLTLMNPLDPATLDTDTDATSDAGYPADASTAGGGPLSRSVTRSTQGSARQSQQPALWHSFHTAPSTPHTRRTAPYAASTSGSSNSGNSFAQSRRPYQAGFGSGSSSIRSDQSSAVIRLATPEDDERLPYVLNLGATDRFRD